MIFHEYIFKIIYLKIYFTVIYIDFYFFVKIAIEILNIF